MAKKQSNCTALLANWIPRWVQLARDDARMPSAHRRELYRDAVHAAKFQYQPALGPPILQPKFGSIYQPFSSIAWGWRYCTSRDERIRQPFFEGEMIVFVGSLLCVSIFFVLVSPFIGIEELGPVIFHRRDNCPESFRRQDEYGVTSKH
jgi:hypothetical protein